MKKFIYGPTGYGKSYNYVAPVIKDNENVILITANGCKLELRCMGLDENILKIVNFDYLSNLKETNIGKLGVDLKESGSNRADYMELVILPTLESCGITNNNNNTIIFSGFYEPFLDADIIDRISEYKANVLIEYCCSRFDLDGGELDYIMKAENWTKIGVFQRRNYDSEKQIKNS